MHPRSQLHGHKLEQSTSKQLFSLEMLPSVSNCTNWSFAEGRARFPRSSANGNHGLEGMADADGVNVGALQLPSVYGRGVSRHI